GIRRDHREHGLNEAAHRRHHFGKFVVGFGVEARVAANFALGFGVIVYAPEMVSVEHGGEGAVEREDFEAVMGEIQLADDFGAEERDYIRAFGEEEAGDDFFSDGGTAEDAATFKDNHFFPGFGQVGGIDEAIMAASDDDYIVELRHS